MTGNKQIRGLTISGTQLEYLLLYKVASLSDYMFRPLSNLMVA